MSEYEDMRKDLVDMIEIINTTIEINAREEQFYRRSAAATTRQVAKDLFQQIADEVGQYLDRMRERRRRLWDALRDLEAAEKEEATGKKAG